MVVNLDSLLDNKKTVDKPFDTLNGVGENYRWQESGELTVRDFNVRQIPTQAKTIVTLAENETCFNQCDDDLADATDFVYAFNTAKLMGVSDPLDGDNVVYVSQDPNECTGVDLSDCSVVAKRCQLLDALWVWLYQPCVVTIECRSDDPRYSQCR